MDLEGIPIEHGIEIEQCERDVPNEILEDPHGDYLGKWISDLSGPREIPGVGPYKQVRSLLKRFNGTMRGHDEERPWTWDNETHHGNGCGSHAHLSIDGSSAEDRVKGYTIAWNAAVELTPFLAPFFCHDWENGFRDGVTRWADPQLTRYAQSTMEGELRSASGRSNGDAITLNTPGSDKPLTIEIRLNEAHPTFAVVGLTYLRRVVTKGMRRDWSPKLAGDRRGTLNELYRALYDAENRGGLVEAMKGVGPIEFEEGRGIPGSEVTTFDSAWDVLLKIMAVNGIDRGAYDHHVKKLVQAAGDGTEVTVPQSEAPTGELDTRAMAADGGEVVLSGAALGPQNNPDAMWQVLDDDFSWDVGPEVDPR